MVHDHLTTKHIPKDSTAYRKRLEHLQDKFKGRCFEQFGIDSLDDLDPIKGSSETSGVISMFKEDGWSVDVIISWLIMESRANCIDWIVDQLLDSMNKSEREKIFEVPVRITDTNKLDINNIYNSDNIWITIDRSLVAFIEYVMRLVHIEIFRSVKDEFLYNPPSHEEVLRLIRKAGSFYHRGEWSSSIHTISKMHFRQVLNLNLTKARIGALFFLIAHEYGHIILNHMSELHQIFRSINSSSFSVSISQEIQADRYAFKLALSTIGKVAPLKQDRVHFEIGIFLFLVVLNLAETVILIELGDDFNEFRRTYAETHGTGFSRLRLLMNDYDDILTPQALSILAEYIDIGNSVAIDLRNMEVSDDET